MLGPLMIWYCICDTAQVASEPGRNRQANVLPYQLQWTSVSCPQCGTVVGQHKYCPNPGGKHPDKWIMRVWDPQAQQWGSRAPWARSLQCSTIGSTDENVRRWIFEMKLACRCIVPPSAVGVPSPAAASGFSGR